MSTDAQIREEYTQWSVTEEGAVAAGEEFDAWLAEVREAAFRKGMERGFINAKSAVETMSIHDPFDVHHVIYTINAAKAHTLAQQHSLSEPYFDAPTATH